MTPTLLDCYLGALGEVHGLDPDLVLGVAGAVLVHRLTGNDTVTVAVGGSWRRVDLSGDVTFRQLLGRVRTADRQPAGVPDVVVDSGARFPNLAGTPDDGGLFAERMRTLLDGLTADLDRPVARVPAVGPVERARILGFNPAPVPGADLPVHEAICRQADRAPNRVAVRGPRKSLTYREVMDRAGLLSGGLQSTGIGPGSVVGLCATSSTDAVIAVVGILLAGAACLPLDPALSRGDRERILRAAGAAVLLTGDDRPGARRRIDRTVDWRSYRTPPEVAAGLAYVRDGVEVTHRGLTNRLAWLQAEHGLTARDAVLHHAPYTRDVSLLELLWPLRYGAQVVIAAPSFRTDARALVRTIRREQVTTVHFVPTMLAAVAAQPGLDRCTSLRTVLCSGEVLPPKTVNRLTARLPVEVHNLYRSAETITGVIAWRCRRPEPSDGVPIGRPTRNTVAYVFDTSGDLAPIGGRGELYVGESGRPDSLLHTGDVACWTGDGALLYLGRTRDEVRIRGRRAEPLRIQTVLEAHPYVRHAVVVPHGTPPAALVAYVVPENDAILDEPALRRYLSNHLREGLAPTRFVPLTRLPLTPDGRLDRSSL